jgi:predicted nuclease of predicted toxin-antitoxin system
MRFLANENFPLASVTRLRKAAHDVAAIVQESPGVRDSQVLEQAAIEARIVLTFDRDYGELIYRRRLPVPAGVVYFRYDPLSPEEPAEHLLRLLTVADLANKYTVVERDRIRQRPLS